MTLPRPKPCPAWLLAGLLGTSLAGCASLPEAQIGPFVDTSIELHSAVAASGSAVTFELRQTQGGETQAERKNLYARDLQGLSSTDKARLKELDALIAGTKSWHGPLQAAPEQTQTRMVTGERLITATAQGTLAWSTTHCQLLTAVEEKRPVNPVALASAITEVQDLIRRIRAL